CLGSLNDRYEEIDDSEIGNIDEVSIKNLQTIDLELIKVFNNNGVQELEEYNG
ncbi:19788_t:CDS:2, partial [Racocetra persica]